MEVANPERALTIYSERNSVGLDSQLEQLFSPPETDLTDEEKQSVEDFANQVFEGKLKDVRRNTPRNLEEIAGINFETSTQKYYLGYFLTEQGKEDLIKMGVTATTEDEVKDQLPDVQLITGNVDAKTRQQIATRSADWYKAKITDALQNDKDLDAAYIDGPVVEIIYEPDKLLSKVGDLIAHRRFYRQIKIAIKKEPESSSKAAKLLELEINIAKANSILIGLQNELINLAKQLEGKKDPASLTWLKRLEELAPVISRAATRDRNLEGRQSFDEFATSFSRRSDYLSYGVAWDENGMLTSISGELVDFAAQVDKENDELDSIGPVFTNEQIQKLKEIKWDAVQFKQFCEQILEQWGILSQYSASWEEAMSRDGPATDNKWQVIENPKSKSLKVDKVKKILLVPQSYNRNLIKTLSVMSHEMTHVAQAESDTAITGQIPIARVGGRRNTSLREGGALDQETKAYSMLGSKRPARASYLAAMKAKLEGGNVVEVARAFYETYQDPATLTEAEKTENMALAADRSLRLYSRGGYNSQPLDYLEGNLIKQRLNAISSRLIEAIMISGAAFSIRDSARLHQAGLYNPPTQPLFSPANDVIKLFKEEYLPQVVV